MKERDAGQEIYNTFECFERRILGSDDGTERDGWMDGGMPVLSKDEMRYLRLNLTEYNIIILENTTSVSGHSLPIVSSDITLHVLPTCPVLNCIPYLFFCFFLVSDWHGDFL